MSDQQWPDSWPNPRDDDQPPFSAWGPVDPPEPPATPGPADEPANAWDAAVPGLTGGGRAAWTISAAGDVGAPPPDIRPWASASVPPTGRPHDGRDQVVGVARVSGPPPEDGQPEDGQPEYGPREYGPREYGTPGPREYGSPVSAQPVSAQPVSAQPDADSASVGSASVGTASVGTASVGTASVGSASVGTAGVGVGARGAAKPGYAARASVPVAAVVGGPGPLDTSRPDRVPRGRNEPDDPAPHPPGHPVGQRRSSHKIRIWMTVNAVVLALIALWVLWPSSQNSTGVDRDLVGQSDKQVGGAAQAAIQPPTKADILAEKLPRFGLSTPNAPWSKSEINTVATAAGIHPTMLQFFVKWTEDFRPDEISASYDQKALPMLSWEPWAGVKAGACQSAYTLPKIINGSFDAYVTKFATAVAAYKLPIALRFAHEMNGNWYPWSESCPGNHAGDYVKAWRHVHDIFTAVGATNVVWTWSPNIVRPVPGVSIRNLYPGDKYVDWVGMVGYAVYETTAAPVFDPTITLIRKFTNLPLIITETGVQSGPAKPGWIKDFFGWLVKHPDVRGFVWFEFSVAQGGSGDWRFTETAASKAAFHDSITKVQLAGPPAGRTVVASPSASP